MCSPLLANIALDGMDELLSQFKKVKVYQYSDKKTGKIKTSQKKSNRYGFVRYCDDFIVTAQIREDIEVIISILIEWLRLRGLELNQEKTNIVHIEQGFNYLGFHIRQFKHSCFTLPQKEKVKEFLKEIRDWLKANPSHKPEAIIAYLNPILRGWGNYYRHGVSKKVFGYIDHCVWKALFQWALKRHPNKGKKWVADKYFKIINGVKWNFATTVQDRQGKNKTFTLFKLAGIPISRHVKVQDKASPDDPQLASYWHKRQTQYGKTYWDKGSKLYNVAMNQDWSCPVCGEHLFNGEQLHTHHIVPVKDGGSDKQENLVHLHSQCHQNLHMGKRSLW